MFVSITTEEVVKRALSAKDTGYYDLGGGARYTEPSPFAVDHNPKPGTCDCSGFLAWSATYDRHDGSNGVDWSTNAIIGDAGKHGAHLRFVVVPAESLVRPGDFVVRGGVDENHDGLPDPGTHGHCGVIVEVLPGFDRLKWGWWHNLMIAHCTPRHGHPGAVRVTDAALWWDSGYLIRPRHITV